MSRICPESWGAGHGHPWTFCVLPAGHPGPHQDWRGNPPDAPLFSDQPEAAEFIRKQREREAKAERDRG